MIKFRKLALLCLSFIIISNLFAQSTVQIDKYRLANGLTVILHQDDSQNGVFGAVGVKVGSKNDPADATGMAHYQEHMLFKGTTELGTLNWPMEKPYIDSIFLMYDLLGKTKDEIERQKIQKSINRLSVKANEYAAPNEFSNLIKEIGGTDLNAFTSPDMTVYHNTFPANQMEKWLELYSHRFVEPVFRGFQSELEVVYEEYNMGADAFIMKLFQEFQKNLFKNHPYGTQTTIGTVEHLKNPSLTKMYDFFKTYYVANNMILVLSGNFDVEKTKELIALKFEKLPSAEIPTFNAPQEKPFVGREKIEVKMTPIKIGVLAFRTVPLGHEDELTLRIVNNLLNNASGSGLLDELSTDNELLFAQVMPLPYHDLGANMMLFIPKIVGQKMEDAENLILGKLKNLHDGNFEDWMLESAKNSLYMEEQRKLESKEGVALELINAEMLNLDLNQVFNNGERIKEITKADIIEIAKKYYGPNYLCFYSLQNLKQSKEKITKPNYKPVVPNTDTASLYALKFKKIESGEPKINFIDFKNDFETMTLGNGHNFYYTKNPKNDIFNLEIEFMVGTETLPLLAYVSTALTYSGTNKIDAKRLKDTFNYLNCSYYFEATEDKFVLSIEGLERNIEAIMPILNEMLTNAKIDDKAIDAIVQGVKSERKLEKSQADELASAIFQYMQFGQKSRYLNRLSVKEVKELTETEILATLKSALQYNTNIHYVGQNDVNQIKDLAQTQLPLAQVPLNVDLTEFKTSINYQEPTIFFVNKKSARQSKVFFSLNTFNNQIDDAYRINAFNLYFGGDFSGLVLQEIREYRSLAYTAGAWVVTPNYSNKPNGFVGYIGTQADKTNEAIDVYYDLLTNMPAKTDRLGMIKDYLLNKAQNDQPSFRNLSAKVVVWQNMGYNQDPRIELINRYENLTFEDINRFYTDNIQKNIITIALAGDSREIDLKALSKYGKVVVLKEKNIFSK